MHHLRKLYNHQDRNELGYLPAEAINFEASVRLNNGIDLGNESEIIAAIGRIKDRWKRPFVAERYFGDKDSAMATVNAALSYRERYDQSDQIRDEIFGPGPLSEEAKQQIRILVASYFRKKGIGHLRI